MKVSVIISACDRRYEMFERSLQTWSNQTLPKQDFEIVMVDDAKRDNLKELCKNYAETRGLKFQFIRVDNEKSVMPIKTFTPVLTNNVGFRQAKGEVVVITGPETLQAEKNLEVAYTLKDRKECAYGTVYRSNMDFMREVGNWDKWKHQPFEKLLHIRGAKADCRTRPPHPPAYYYLMAVAKEYVEKIGGLDERFAQGFCGEDDDFSNRMKLAGIEPVFEYKMVGIHQDHSQEDKGSPAHALRRTPEGARLRQKNIALLHSNLTSGKYLANDLPKTAHNYDPEYIWGDPRVIIEHEIY